MTKREVNQNILCLCLFLSAGILTSTFAGTADTITQQQCLTPSNDAVFPANDGNCFDRCEEECKPGHWYSGLCRFFCRLGCTPLYPTA